MTEVIQAAAELQAVCQAQGWRFCFIGGLAVLRWGEPRETVDADLTLLTGFDHEQEFIDELLRHFEGRIPDAGAFALDRRVLLLRSRTGVGLDVALGALPFEERVVQRSSWFDYPPAVSLRTCSAEDLVVMKAFAGRGQDWVDVERIILETGVNAKTQRRKDAERKELRRVAKLNHVHLRGECGSTTIQAGSLCGSASLRLCVKFQLPKLGSSSGRPGSWTGITSGSNCVRWRS